MLHPPLNLLHPPRLSRPRKALPVEHPPTPLALLARHAAGDWGDLGLEDKQLNERALRDGVRIFSAYRFAAGFKVWVITEADRNAATVLLPDEY